MTTSHVLGWLAVAAITVGIIVALLPSGAAAIVAVGAVLAAGLLMRSHPPERPPPSREAPAATPPDRGQMAALLDLFSEGILLLDRENTVLVANRAAAQMLGRPRELMTHVSLIRAARDHVFLDVLRESAAQPREVELDGERLIFATATPVESGEIRTVLTLQDQTALRRAERARQDLVANVSHELRTPIAAALALAETLEAGVDEPDRRERFARQLTTEIERLGRIVDRLLRLSRIESRVEAFEVESLDVEPLLDEAIRRIGPVAERQRVELQRDVAPGTPPVRADHERVLEVLSNLVDNAIRHSPVGAMVFLSARPDRGRVRFDVRDQGSGIMPHDRVRIFERFYTGDRSRGDGLGTGLGLAIARHIVSRLGGEIWVADAGPGATLSFTVPVAEGDGTQPGLGADRS